MWSAPRRRPSQARARPWPGKRGGRGGGASRKPFSRSPMQVATQASHPSSINDQATQGQTRRDSPARCSLEFHTQSHRTPKIALAFMRRCTWWHACPLPRPHPPPPTPCLTRKSRPECDLPHHAARPIWHPLAHPRWINRQSTRSSSGDSTRRESARRGGDQQRDPPR